MAELTSADERVRFFDNPKGERHGEAHRHAALQRGPGRDRLLPLRRRPLAAGPRRGGSSALLADSRPRAHAVALDRPRRAASSWRSTSRATFYREVLLGGESRIHHLAARAHARALPAAAGRLAADAGGDLRATSISGSDLSRCRAPGGQRHRPTVLHFPSRHRVGWSIEERIDGDRPLDGSRADRHGATGCRSECSTTCCPTGPRLDEAARDPRGREVAGCRADEQLDGSRALALQEEQARLSLAHERERDLLALVVRDLAAARAPRRPDACARRSERLPGL